MTLSAAQYSLLSEILKWYNMELDSKLQLYPDRAPFALKRNALYQRRVTLRQILYRVEFAERNPDGSVTID